MAPISRGTMPETLRRLISPEYLAVPEPGPMGAMWPLYAGLGALFAALLGTAVWALATRGKDPQLPALRAWAWFEIWICTAGLAAVVARFLVWPGWSARIWPVSLAVLAACGVVALWFRRVRPSPLVAEQLRILAVSPLASVRSRRAPVGTIVWLVAGLSLHLAGLALILAARYGQPLWLAPALLALLLVPQLPALVQRKMPRLMALAPMLGAYATTLLWLAYRWQGITVVGWQGLAFPNPLLSVFYVDGIIMAAVGLSLLCQLNVTAGRLRKRAFLWRWAVVGLLCATLVWAVVVYIGKRTHGTTASDPYAYAQMAVDLAERGTFLHRFALFEDVMPLDIAWAPLQPVGYHVPRNEMGDSPSVWATGASVLLAGGYFLLGEEGLYITTPIVALLALGATWALVQQVLRGEPRFVRHLTAAIAVALLATSPEYVDRVLVPMADASAQLFTVLALLFTLRAMHELEQDQRSSAFSLLIAGLCFGWAYWVRHTQLVLAIPVLLAIVLGLRSKPRSMWEMVWPFLLLFGAALLAAFPDIWYRWRVFGGPFSTETTELPSMGLGYVAPVAFKTLHDTLAAGEWGYLFPLALYGIYRLARDHGRETDVLGSAFLAVLFVHLTYRFLRLRDLISLFPLADLAVAYGAVAIARLARGMTTHSRQITRLGYPLLAATLMAWLVLGFALARWNMVGTMWKPGQASFGYVRPEQREAFDRLAEVTPSDGVIGASLNAGAVMLYTTREAIRPYDSWTDGEWAIFLEAMDTARRPVFLLDDGELMATFIAREATRHRLTPIEALDLPLFGASDGNAAWLYRVERTP